MKTNLKYIEQLICIFFLVVSCQHGLNTQSRMEEKINISNIDFSKLQKKRIYFGHMSVGQNILDGMSGIVTNNKIPIRIKNINDATDDSLGFVMESKIGKNGDPYSKINAFPEMIKKLDKEKLDVAFFKFCYVDFSSNTNVDSVFQIYSETIDSLSKTYPDVEFVHATVPLRIIESGPKAFIKRIIGKDIGYEGNLARNKFNVLLKNKYEGKSPIFDIALLESTYQNGNREVHDYNNVPVYSLVSDYTSDGGHLNEFGKNLLGEQLLIFLSGF